jgi:hypothetical protein
MSKATESKKTDDALAEFLANGGVIQQIERNVSGREEGATYWGSPKKKAGRPAAGDAAPTTESNDE